LATPIGHRLFGLSIVRTAGSQSTAPTSRRYLFAAVAPDFDLFPGLLIGVANHFHQGVSHSLAAAVAFGAVSTLAARWLGAKPLRVGITGVVLFSSPLSLDLFVEDKRTPFGVPLFWPVHDGYRMSPVTFLGCVKHGIPGDTIAAFVQSVLSWHNVEAAAIKILIFVPLLIPSWYLTQARWKGRPRKHSIHSGPGELLEAGRGAGYQTPELPTLGMFLKS